MNHMMRRQFLKEVGLGSAAVVTGVLAGSRAAGQGRGNDQDDHVVDGPLASATVSFGAWPVGGEEPLDRTLTPDAPIAPNVHALIPNSVTIMAGGTVNYIVAGFHQIVVYEPGKEPADVDTQNLIPVPGAPPEVGLIDDPAMRLYRGASPIELPQDRVEVVHFAERGIYLVICAVNIHFAEGMFGWVIVLG